MLVTKQTFELSLVRATEIKSKRHQDKTPAFQSVHKSNRTRIGRKSSHS